jgi:succinate-semialdehyde dehydrogenase/glutarate-semialdehyde dehydrogenase
VPYRSVNPATGEVLKTFPELTDQQVMDTLATADRAFRTWSARLGLEEFVNKKLILVANAAA